MGNEHDDLVLDAIALEARLTEMRRLFHMVLRRSQAAYSAGLREGPEACMKYLGNALRGPGHLPPEGSDPDWYAEDAWTEGPPWQAIPAANATLSEPSHPASKEAHDGRR